MGVIYEFFKYTVARNGYLGLTEAASRLEQSDVT
jgi:hypothetical protein